MSFNSINNEAMINSNNIRLRFAPSPTGYLHVGGLRTALFNFLFAKKNNGKLILRIEDTDQSRLVKDSIQNIIDVLNWTGIDFDEGPHCKNNKFGPYIQSERLDIYHKNMLTLLKSKKVYVCFYSDDRMKAIEDSKEEKQIAAEYDKRYKNLSFEEATSRMKNEKYIVRLAMPTNGKIIINDIVKGKLQFDYALIDDPIMIKSDGYPTYHFANVIDDHHMNISHVIRGEEWLPSLPKHAYLYECFNWTTPDFAHLPLLLNKDKSKLSKRQGDVAVEDYIKKGYLKEALINFVALLGWHESNDQEFYSLQDLIKVFSLERIQSSGAVFDIDKLNWLNNQYIKKTSSNDIIKVSKNYLNHNWEITESMVDLIKDKLNTLNDLEAELSIFFEDPKINSKSINEKFPDYNVQIIIKNAVEVFEKLDNFDPSLFKTIMSNIQTQSNCQSKELWQTIRFVLTGEIHGPDLASFISILGRKRCIQRFNNAS